MDKEQQKALKSLERAFKKCKEAQISFYGMDGELYAISKTEENTDLTSKYGTDDKLHESLNDNATVVDTHRSYKDSGGF